jgi:hypothetical protein
LPAAFGDDSPPSKQLPFHGLREIAFEINPGGQAAETRPGSSQPNWVNGFSFLPDPCHIPEVLDHCTGLPAAYDQVTNPYPAREPVKCIDDMPALVEHYPSWVKVAERCTLQNRLHVNFVDRLQRHLDIVSGIAYESEFMTGLNSPEDPANLGTPINQSLQHDAVDIGGGAPYSTADAMALAIQHLTTTGVGELGMIHAPPAVVAKWCRGDSVYTDDDGRMRHCARGDYVVVGGGYSGQGPIGDPNEVPPPNNYWVYTTGLVYKHEGIDVIVDDETSPNNNGNVQTTEPDINDYSVLVERPFALFHDGCKQTGAILVDLCATGGCC